MAAAGLWVAPCPSRVASGPGRRRECDERGDGRLGLHDDRDRQLGLAGESGNMTGKTTADSTGD